MHRNIDWPRKTRDVHTYHFDSTTWDDLKFRDDDINGRWHGCLTESECAEYEKRAETELGAGCAWWLANGGHFPHDA